MKRVLVTGSSTGFGKDLCVSFLERGWQVYASLRNAKARGELFAAERERFGDRLCLVSLDVADPAERETAAALIEARGGLDCLVNNAGFGQFGPFEAVTEEEWRRQMEVNFFAPVLLLRRLLPALRRSRGRVINISSILGLAGFPLASPYASSKWALEGLSEALYYELRPHGVQVAVVEPGGFRTKFNDNIQVARPPADSPYAAQLESYLRLRAKKAAGNGVSPEPVIRKIVRLAEARRMPLRTVVGTDAVALDALGRALPRNWATSLMSSVYGAFMPAKPT